MEKGIGVKCGFIFLLHLLIRFRFCPGFFMDCKGLYKVKMSTKNNITMEVFESRSHLDFFGKSFQNSDTDILVWTPSGPGKGVRSLQVAADQR